LTLYDSLKTLSRIATPVKIVIFAYLFVLLANHADANFAPSAVLSFPGKSGWNWVIFATWLNASAAGWLTMITDAADFCRYSRTRTDMWVGTLSAAAIGTLVSGALGAYAAVAQTNPARCGVAVPSGWPVTY
jgi:NCS1 family nucleobase:cation symporter-1